MCDFKLGDELVCIEAGRLNIIPWLAPADATLVVGQVYTVLAVTIDEELAQPRVHLLEARNGEPWNGYPDEGFGAWRFRKVQRRGLTAWLAAENAIEGPVRNPAKEPA